MALYGAGVLWNSAYGTADGSVPWGFFWLLYREIPQVLAMQRVQLTTSTALAHGILSGGRQAKDAADRDLREAFPDG